MAWPRGKPRPDGAGRRAGTPNKSTQSLMDICVEEGIDPFRALCKFAKDKDPLVSMRAIERMCEYLYSKRKAIEVSADIDMKLLERIKEIQTLPEKELLKIVTQKKKE